MPIHTIGPSILSRRITTLGPRPSTFPPRNPPRPVAIRPRTLSRLRLLPIMPTSTTAAPVPASLTIPMPFRPVQLSTAATTSTTIAIGRPPESPITRHLLSPISRLRVSGPPAFFPFPFFSFSGTFYVGAPPVLTSSFLLLLFLLACSYFPSPSTSSAAVDGNESGTILPSVGWVAVECSVCRLRWSIVPLSLDLAWWWWRRKPTPSPSPRSRSRSRTQI